MKQMVRGRQRLEVEKSLVGFVVGSVTYAVPIGEVREIANPQPVVPLPHAPSTVIGVADHRGQVIPVVDLRIRFGAPGGGDPRKVKWILVRVGDRTLALVVDRVTEVFGTTGEGLREPPHLGGGEADRCLLGVCRTPKTMVFVLDLSEFEDLTRGLECADGERGGAP